MPLSEIKEAVGNKLTALERDRGYALQAGEVDRMALLDIAIAETQQTLQQLTSIPS